MMDLTAVDLDSLSDDELTARLMHDPEFGAAIDLARHIRERDTQTADTMARRERRVVMSERLRHTDEGPVRVPYYIGVKESGDLFVTDVGHEAKVDTDLYELTALAARASREIGGYWYAMETRQLARPSWAQLTDSRATMEL